MEKYTQAQIYNLCFFVQRDPTLLLNSKLTFLHLTARNVTCEHKNRSHSLEVTCFDLLLIVFTHVKRFYSFTYQWIIITLFYFIEIEIEVLLPFSIWSSLVTAPT